MKLLRTFALVGLTGAIVAGTLVNAALAAEPRGTIKKSVQNQTTNSERSEADNQGNALDVRSGDILKYTIEIRNEGDSDMHNTRLSDTLPSGIELISNPSTRQITEDIGLIQAGKTETKTYLVKVTADKEGEIIENKACFNGDSEAKDAEQNGCNSAFVKIVAAKAPPKKPEPTPEKPEEPKKPEKPAPESPGKKLPTTGPSTAATSLATVGAGTAGYIGRLFVIKRRRE